MQNADTRWKDAIAKVSGRRRGTLYRADRDYHAIAGWEKNAKQIHNEMVQQMRIVNDIDASMTDKGWTKGKYMKKIGSIPFAVMLAHPEFWHDTDAMLRFLNDNPRWRADWRTPRK